MSDGCIQCDVRWVACDCLFHALKKLKEINILMEKADLCDCDWEPACQECLEAWIEAKRMSS